MSSAVLVSVAVTLAVPIVGLVVVEGVGGTVLGLALLLHVGMVRTLLDATMLEVFIDSALSVHVGT